MRELTIEALEEPQVGEAPAIQPTIAVVGCGFVGSIFLEELAKRLFAFEMTGAWQINLHDYDNIELRNAANQNFRPSQDEWPKVEALEDLLFTYGCHPTAYNRMVTQDNIGELIHPQTQLLVDAVDKLPVRTMLWYYAMQHKIPVLHIGVSQGGTGAVEWSDIDSGTETWSLSPMALAGMRANVEESEVVELPPCELVAFRGLGLNVGLAAAKAVMIWMGNDAERDVSASPAVGTMTTWSANQRGHTLLEHMDPVNGEHKLHIANGG